ncbi:MAG: hypothetical protein BWK73_10195 [Thiothrix lacustris]|uniref:Uncharacterized protein n=1 Tax=Thiothrix lacustris TaxID=525917 RepID=A0A1Y1QUK3_9GAMM|nr:MAG: hypothetical protein BWK73_10195 [Thiothrix lacustris]
MIGFELSLVLGIGFGILAAVMAFVIVYEAYKRHRFSGYRLWRESLLAAAFAFIVFLALSIAAGYALRWVF